MLYDILKLKNKLKPGVVILTLANEVSLKIKKMNEEGRGVLVHCIASVTGPPMQPMDSIFQRRHSRSFLVPLFLPRVTI